MEVVLTSGVEGVPEATTFNVSVPKPPSKLSPAVSVPVVAALLSTPTKVSSPAV